MNVTHKIISMERSETKNSNSPMWRCTTESGDKVNVFLHNDPVKNTFAFFASAGYAEDMKVLPLNARLIWRTHPIAVELKRSPDGKWWDFVAVAPKPAGACPDVPFIPEHRLYRDRAHRWAVELLEGGSDANPVIIVDVETTGTNKDDEIISIGAVNVAHETLLDDLVKPVNLARVETLTHLHGITPDDLISVRSWPQLYSLVANTLNRAIWIAYNARFDTQMIEYSCVQHGLVPCYPLAVIDAMKYISEYLGQWDAERENYIPPKLTEAAAMLGVQVQIAHSARADAITLLKCIEAMADGVVPTPLDNIPF